MVLPSILALCLPQIGFIQVSALVAVYLGRSITAQLPMINEIAISDSSELLAKLTSPHSFRMRWFAQGLPLIILTLYL